MEKRNDQGQVNSGNSYANDPDWVSDCHFVSTFYQFLPLKDFENIKLTLEKFASDYKVEGLMILGQEGFNTTVSSNSAEGLQGFKDSICSYFELPNLFFKDSISRIKPFRRFKIKIRPEIVTLGTPELVPHSGQKNNHLSPKEWNRILKEEKVLLIDTRNWYETEIGTFKGSINPGIDKFTEFPNFMKAHQIEQDKKILIFCTGGIRCEKGILELQRQGFQNVYQLDGGIINYLKQFPDDQFEGECFVFDQRVALDQKLNPTQKYSLCPHCGQPGESPIICSQCHKEQIICNNCYKLPVKKDTCSKNCAYHFHRASAKNKTIDKESEVNQIPLV